MSARSVLVVDDDPEIVRLLRSYLVRAGFRVQVALTGSDALSLLASAPPDLMILDLMLPDQDGWEITRRVRRDPALAALPIIMLTARVDDSDKIMGLEIGADDYMTKPFNPHEVIARVRARLRRHGAPEEEEDVLIVGSLRLDSGRHTVELEGRALDLTPTEFNLLRCLMASPGQVFSRSVLIDRVLGEGFAGYERTLDSHIKNLRRKIEIDSRRRGLIETVYGVGYRMRDEEA